jgi:cell division septal protein FtsQ
MADSEDQNNDKKDSEPQESGGQQEFAFDAGSSRKSRLWIFAALLLIGGAVAIGLYWSQSIRVEKITVNGTDLADAEQISNRAQFAVGIKRDSLSMLRVLDSVRRVDFVRSADISVNLNGTLELDIAERQPIALLADQSPKMWVDKDGVLLPLRLGRSINVPLLYGFTGKNSRDTLKSDAFSQVSRFLTTARQHDFTWSTLSEVTYQKERGIIAVSGEESVRLVFGKKDFKRKMGYWKAYYGQVLKYKQNPGHREVDLRYEGQIVTR